MSLLGPQTVMLDLYWLPGKSLDFIHENWELGRDNWLASFECMELVEDQFLF